MYMYHKHLLTALHVNKYFEMVNSINKYKSIIECNRMLIQLKHITLDQQEMVDKLQKYV